MPFLPSIADTGLVAHQHVEAPQAEALAVNEGMHDARAPGCT